jgi:hypothetical protein
MCAAGSISCEILARFCGFSRCYGQENFPSRVFGADFAGSPRRGERRNDALLLITTTTSRFGDSRMHPRRSDGRRQAPISVLHRAISSRWAPFSATGNLVTFNFGILAALGRSARSAARLVPDVVASRLLKPYHFPALIQSFQSVAAPFPGDCNSQAVVSPNCHRFVETDPGRLIVRDGGRRI